MYIRLSRWLAAGLLLAAAFSAPASAAEPLTPEQKKAVEQLVHDYILNHPEVLIEAVRSSQERDKAQADANARSAIAEKRQELLADPESPIAGNPTGDVTIVEFFDYRCPYCKQVEPLLEALLKEDPKLRIVYKEFPILGPASLVASQAALAAHKQGKYAAFHDAMMALKGQVDEKVILGIASKAGLDMDHLKADMAGEAVDNTIKRNYELAEALNIQGTPAFIVGDDLAPGATDIATLRKMVAAARKKG